MVPVDASAVVVLRRRVSLDFDGVRLGTVLDQIAQQAGVRLNYSRSLLRLDAPVSIHARRLTVAAALTEVLLDAGVDVVVMSSGQVSLRKHVQRQVGAIVGELPLETKIPFAPRLGVGRNDRREQRALLDLFANPAVPRIAAAKFALVEPHVDAGCTQGAEQTLLLRRECHEPVQHDIT